MHIKAKKTTTLREHDFPHHHLNAKAETLWISFLKYAHKSILFHQRTYMAGASGALGTCKPTWFFNVFRYPLQFGGSDNSCIFGKVCVIVDKSIL